MEKLSQVLWRERELLDTLLYHLEVERLVLGAGRTPWLARASDDVERDLLRLRETEILRSVVAEEAAAELGMPPSPSLRALADSVEEPWHSILVDHRDAFVALSREISLVADDNRTLLSSGLRWAREALLAVDEETVQGYGRDGTLVAAPSASRLVDRSL
ncbi:flagellar export chaperone FlgN [Lapillicoccus jejuensis]|uniref:FlgN protein n=1 Tax=Lapillicoccus jejuensis TaxID=402171 RepID=A0A542E4D4_9MICO|nr:flagellar export chaperone FlgN [Lapillicoccus jejuensis]TQJ10175.1 FlgN protein [Lapillicoccus jejuensis]